METKDKVMKTIELRAGEGGSDRQFEILSH
jgi:hypothetical protein